MDPKSMDQVDSVDEKKQREADLPPEAKPDLAARDAELDELKKPIERRERESEAREHGELTEE